MDGWWKLHSLRLVLLAATALVPAARLHADGLTHSAPPAWDPSLAARVPFAAHTSVPPRTGWDLSTLRRAAGRCLTQVHADLAREFVALQLPLIGGHAASPPTPKKHKSAPPPPGSQGGTGSPPSPPPPPSPPTPPSNPNDPTGNGGVPPSGLGNPPPASTPEPASVLLALAGAGAASFVGWQRKGK